MKLEGVKISGLRRLIHGRHGPIKLRRRLGLMQPKLRVGDGLGGLDQPDTGLWVVDQNGTARKLLAQGDLTAGANALDGLIIDFNAGALFQSSCQC